MREDEKYILALHKILGLNLNKYFMKLYQYYECFEQVWKCKKIASEIGMSISHRERFEVCRKTVEPLRIEEDYCRKGIGYITRLNQSYPKLMLQISNIPCILYYCGDVSLIDKQALAIVGSRRATSYGLRQARLMAGELSKNGLVIVSGMARGIDSAAHQGALEEDGETIAVLGSGVDIPYPRENRSLYTEISKRGLVLSEYPPGTEPLSYNFPIRNRIISGLSLGVFIVEAQAKSGSLITCDCALEQGKEVFALPGPVVSPNSVGPLRLIQQGAKLIIYPQEILEQLGYEYSRCVYDKQKDKRKEVKESEKQIYNNISWEPVNINELLDKNPDDQGKVIRILLELEIKGLIRQLPGKYYVRV